MNKTYQIVMKLILATLILTASILQAIEGKVDVGGAWVVVDVLESGKTVETMHMKAFKADATIGGFYQGWFIKPNVLIARGDGRLNTFSFGVGHFFPMGYFFSACDKLLLMPSVGIAFSYLRTKIDLEEICQFDLTEKFRSTSPYLAIEFTYKLTNKWTLMGMYQYAFSTTHTTIRPFVSDKSHSEGPNYALGIEYMIDCNWAITAGVGYNITLSHEKHGLRGKGAKLGVAYYF